MTEMTDYPTNITVTVGEPRPAFEPAPTPNLTELSLRINTLEREVERVTDLHQRCQVANVEYENQKSEFEDRLKDAVENDEIDGDLAKEFADIFDLTLDKEYRITLEASWTGTITVPFGFDVDNLDFEFPFPELSYSCNECDMDIDEDNTSHDVSDVY
jgi:hypothetical protein